MIDEILDGILRREGAEFTNDPADAGGPTRFGVTQATLSAHRGASASAADVEALTETEAREIYRARYVKAPGFDQIDHPALMALMVDTAVHCGVGRAIRWLQAALDIPVDGFVGPTTLGTLKARDPIQVYCFVLAERARHYARLYKTESQRKFAGGWTVRLAEFIEKTPTA